MSPAAEIGLVAARELRKSIRSLKGIILGILTLLASVLTVFICIWGETGVRHTVGGGSTEVFQDLYEQALIKAGADATIAHFRAHMPISLIAFSKVLIWAGPLLVAILGFDVVAGDLQHRTVRFWTVRARRWSWLLGKFFGLWGIVAVVTFVLMVLSSLAIAIRGYITVGDFFTWSLRCWAVSTLIVGAWTAVATFVSSQFKTPLLALLATLGAFFCMWVPGFIGWAVRWGTAIQQQTNMEAAKAAVINIKWYEYVYPGQYDDLLFSPRPSDVAQGMGACALYMLLFVGLSTALFAKKDV